MKNIYVVTSGEYSDYGIITTFSKLKDAQRFVELQDDSWSQHRIETWQIDNCLDGIVKIPEGKFVFKVVMDRGGCTDDYGVHKDYGAEVGIEFRAYNSILMYMEVTVIAVDHKAAVKIANEKRVQLIASGEWDRAMVEMKEFCAKSRYNRFRKKIL